MNTWGRMVSRRCSVTQDVSLRSSGMKKTAVGRFDSFAVPPRRLELRSSAPEADTLSTELRGRTEGILSQIK